MDIKIITMNDGLNIHMRQCNEIGDRIIFHLNLIFNVEVKCNK